MSRVSSLALRVAKAKQENSEKFISGPGAYERIVYPGYTEIGAYVESGILVDCLRSEATACECPYCHHIATRRHDTCSRMIQNICPEGYTSYLYVEFSSFVCENPQCEHKTFREPLRFAAKYRRRTINLDVLILGQATTTSLRGTARMMAQSKVCISRPTVERMVMSIDFIISEEPTEIGVDDICGRKNDYYYTNVVDAKTHAPIALLDGRNGSELKKWEQEHPGVVLINRDRGSGYSKVSYETYGDKCKQVADPFHLDDGLIVRLKQEIPSGEKQLLDNVWVEATVNGDEISAKLLPSPPKKIYSEAKVDVALVAALPEYTCDPPRNPDGTLTNYNFSTTNVTKKVAEERAKNRSATYKKVCEVRSYRDELLKNEQKVVIADISRHFSISQPTVKKYLNMSEDDVGNLLEPRRYAKTEPASPYIHMIYKMLRDGYSAYQIFCYIKTRTDFKGSDEALATYINTQISNNFSGVKQLNLCKYREENYPENVFHFTYNSIAKGVFTVNPKTKRNPIIAALLDSILELCPTTKKARECMQDFYAIMHGDDPDAIDGFIKKYADFIPGFCTGLKLDIIAVKNAILTKTSSGYVEGNNTAFKLVKRMGCGRYKLPCLRAKYFLFLLRKYKNFNLRAIVETRTIDISECAKDGVVNY